MRAGDCTFGVMSDPVADATTSWSTARAPTASELAAAIANAEQSPVDVVAAAVERALAVQPTAQLLHRDLG